MENDKIQEILDNSGYDFKYQVVESHVYSLMQAAVDMAQDKWISVEDKTPKNRHWYRVLQNGKHHILPHSYYKGKWFEYGQPFATEMKITHWQPFEDLPQPPIK